MAQRRHTLGCELQTKTLVYLDTRYWIFLRDAAQGVSKNPLHRTLLEVLREGVHAGDLACPISQTTFLELLHIGDVDRRLATAEMIQELSLGVTLGEERELVSNEIILALNQKSGDRIALRSAAWQKLSYVFGFPIPSDERFSKAEQLVIAKAFFDHLWDMPLTNMLRQLGQRGELPDFPYESIAQHVHSGNLEHAESVGSFKATYLDEIIGTLDLFKHVVANFIRRKAIDEGIRAPSAQECVESERNAFQLLAAMARQGKGAQAFPTLHVGAKLHAAIRRDKLRPFRRNDLPDFHHAAAALVYCDAFLTERSLRALIRSGGVKLDTEFSCTVVADEAEAAAWIRQKVRRPSLGIR